MSIAASIAPHIGGIADLDYTETGFYLRSPVATSKPTTDIIVSRHGMPVSHTDFFRGGAMPTCLAAALLTISPVSAQYRFDSWTIDNGLPQNSIQAMVQTRDGYLWLSTLGGLARFDGVRFRVFNRANTPQLSTSEFAFFALHREWRCDPLLRWQVHRLHQSRRPPQRQCSPHR
jgi:hypothetical protein